MYQLLADRLALLCRVPPQPDPPPGDEATATVFRAAPGYWRYRLTGWAIVSAAVTAGALGLLVIAIASAHRHPGDAAVVACLGTAVAGLVVMMLGLWWVTLRLDYDFRWYLLTDRSLRVREGVWVVREMTVTFANVQNLSVQQGPIERLFGISSVKVETAGGGGGKGGPSGAHQFQAGRSLHTAWLRGVANAEEIKDLIQRRIRGVRDAGLGDLDDTQPVPSPRGAPAAAAAAAMLAEVRGLRQAVTALASRLS